MRLSRAKQQIPFHQLAASSELHRADDRDFSRAK
jgi:hypothetical protein